MFRKSLLSRSLSLVFSGSAVLASAQQPATLQLGMVIAGWTEGLQMMVEGEKMRLWIPEELAYKHEQQPFGMLVFDIELLSVQ